MQLLALTPEERAFLQGGGHDKLVAMLAARLRQRLIASLGIAIDVGETGGFSQTLANSAAPGSLSDLSDRSEPGGRARPVLRDFEAHSQAMQRGIGEKWTALPTGAVDQSQVRQAPGIEFEPPLAAAWLSVRLGGAADGNWTVRDAALLQPLQRLVRRALAETVINSGEANWPQAMRLQVKIGAQQGAVEIHWNGAGAMAWARREIRERA